MKSMIFIAAGGKGKRLGTTIPKSLVKINGKPIIDHIITTSLQANIDKIVVGIDDGKEDIVNHLPKNITVQQKCFEPLSLPFLRAIQENNAQIAIGTNGDTIYRPESLKRVIKLLISNPDATAAVLLTKITKPLEESSWTYWRYKVENNIVTTMEEVPGHNIKTEFVVAAFNRNAIKSLSRGFREDFSEYKNLPFQSYSLGWDYLLRICLWQKHKIMGLISDDLSININTPHDIKEAELFFNDPGLFRWQRTTPNGTNEPIMQEQSLLLIKPQAIKLGITDYLKHAVPQFGLKITKEKIYRFSQATAKKWLVNAADRSWFEEASQLLCDGLSIVMLVEGRGGFYRALSWKKSMRQKFAKSQTNNLVHATFSPWSFETELEREKNILNL